MPLPSPPPEPGDAMAMDTTAELVDTQPVETQVATQVASQDPMRQPDLHLWGYLIPCNPRLRRLDFLKSQPEYRIGRNKQVGNDFTFPGMKVSNNHCTIKWDERLDRSSVVQILDQSSNGTFINGERIGKGRFGVLKEGNEVAFGMCQPQPDSMEDYRFIYRHMAAGLPTEGLYAHYELVEELGKGSFATVMKAMSKATGQWYACKMIHVKQLKASVAGKIRDPAVALHKEVQILERLQHKNICQLKEVFYDPQYINIILELVPGGDLLDYILKRDGLPEDEAKDITYQLCDALAYIHSQGIAHRDLKPENVLLTNDVPPVVKVADFGLAKAIDSLTMLRTMCGTPSYLAPEVVTQGEQEGYQQIVDSWSVGVIVFSMITNTSPFIEPDHTTDIKLKIIQRTIDWPTLEGTGPSTSSKIFS
ncbi:hypothetical protein NM688_g3677 [Phlebia brevispora]|uniref:Uncharacterized protein n=1 Tax=Phlebia brevispora TaxID=194682 RepID=A0ACC1T4V4_9APHY|nr:hypothetical protein NM688_g3677 [Phlebia brevispora]